MDAHLFYFNFIRCKAQLNNCFDWILWRCINKNYYYYYEGESILHTKTISLTMIRLIILRLFSGHHNVCRTAVVVSLYATRTLHRGIGYYLKHHRIKVQVNMREQHNIPQVSIVI